LTRYEIIVDKLYIYKKISKLESQASIVPGQH